MIASWSRRRRCSRSRRSRMASVTASVMLSPVRRASSTAKSCASLLLMYRLMTRASGRAGGGGAGGGAQRLVEVGDDVGRGLEANREPHDLRPGACLAQLLLVELAMRGRGRMDDQRARVADVGEMREQLARLDHAHARLVAADEPEGEHRTRAARHVALGERAVRAVRQAGIGYPGDRRMLC